MSIEIRSWSEADVAEVAKIERECFSDPWTEEMLYQEVRRLDFFGLILQSGEEKLAYVCGTLLFEDAELPRIAVRAEYRGKGFGGKLLDAFIEEVKTRGGERIFLEVRTSNESALGLYQSRGFETLRVRKKYYSNGEDAFEMRKTL